MNASGESSQNVAKDDKDGNESDDLVKNLRNLPQSEQQRLALILNSLQSQEAIFGEDENGRPVIHYKKPQTLNWDASNANMVAKPRTEVDIKQKTAFFVEFIQYLKKNKAPSGVTLDSTKVSPFVGQYGKDQFEVTGEILGKGNCAGDIVVVKDKVTGSENAHKTVMITAFRPQEIEAWVDLNDDDIGPRLYLFKLEGNKIHLHMEKIDTAVTLRKIIDDHMFKLRTDNPGLVRPFSLCMFHDILDKVQRIHSKDWTHRDLHADNIMVQKEGDQSMKVRIIDFGSANKISDKDGLRGFRSDIIEVVRKFSALYTGEEFDSQLDVQRSWKQKMELMTDQLKMAYEDKLELFHLIDSALQIVCPSEVQNLKDEVKQKIDDLNIEKDEMMREVIKILFPEVQGGDGKVSHIDTSAAGDGNVMDAANSGKDLLSYFRQQIGIGRFL